MKRVLLTLRLLVEAMVGCICVLLMAHLTKDPLVILVIGFLGMPRRYHPTYGGHFNNLLVVAEVLEVTVLLLIGVACFVDVARRLRGRTAR